MKPFHAIRPWDSPTCLERPEPPARKESKAKAVDPYCFTCQLPSEFCDECKGPKTAQRMQRREDIIRDLKNGASNEEMKEKYGFAVGHANWYRRRYADQIGDPCQRCYSAEVCQRVGGTCNEKERWTG